MSSMGGHERPHRGESDIWLTPKHIIDALGPFDLDPCAAPTPRPWPTATVHYELPTDGLREPWFGRVWLNPPYGPEAGKFLKRLSEHGSGTALIFARTETRWWFDSVWDNASAVLFLKGRLTFHRQSGEKGPGNSGAPSALVAYGSEDEQRLLWSGLEGAFVSLSKQRAYPCELSVEAVAA